MMSEADLFDLYDAISDVSNPGATAARRTQAADLHGASKGPVAVPASGQAAPAEGRRAAVPGADTHVVEYVSGTPVKTADDAVQATHTEVAAIASPTGKAPIVKKKPSRAAGTSAPVQVAAPAPAPPAAAAAAETPKAEPSAEKTTLAEGVETEAVKAHSMSPEPRDPHRERARQQAAQAHTPPISTTPPHQPNAPAVETTTGPHSAEHSLLPKTNVLPEKQVHDDAPAALLRAPQQQQPKPKPAAKTADASRHNEARHDKNASAEAVLVKETTTPRRPETPKCEEQLKPRGSKKKEEEKGKEKEKEKEKEDDRAPDADTPAPHSVGHHAQKAQPEETEALPSAPTPLPTAPPKEAVHAPAATRQEADAVGSHDPVAHAPVKEQSDPNATDTHVDPETAPSCPPPVIAQPLPEPVVVPPAEDITTPAPEEQTEAAVIAAGPLGTPLAAASPPSTTVANSEPRATAQASRGHTPQRALAHPATPHDVVRPKRATGSSAPTTPKRKASTVLAATTTVSTTPTKRKSSHPSSAIASHRRASDAPTTLTAAAKVGPGRSLATPVEAEAEPTSSSATGGGKKKGKARRGSKTAPATTGGAGDAPTSPVDHLAGRPSLNRKPLRKPQGTLDDAAAEAMLQELLQETAAACGEESSALRRGKAQPTLTEPVPSAAAQASRQAEIERRRQQRQKVLAMYDRNGHRLQAKEEDEGPHRSTVHSRKAPKTPVNKS